MKRIVLQAVERKQPRPFKEVWGRLEQELRKAHSGEQSLLEQKKLLVPLTDADVFATVDDFGSALFEALRDCLSDFEVKVLAMDRSAIVLKVEESGRYAVGISCQKASTNTQTHCVCLFEKERDDDGKWKVKDCFATVLLKMSDSDGCEDFSLSENGRVETTDLADKHSALAEAIVHTLQCDLLGHARGGHLPDHIPIAIISGRKGGHNIEKLSLQYTNQSKAKKPKNQVQLRCILGTLNIPKACGDRFSYSVNDFGAGQDYGIDSVEKALSIYLESILFGFSSAMRAYSGITGTNILLRPVAASGRYVMIGETTLNLRLCASPIIPGANRIQTQNEDDLWNSSQGELFSGRLNVRDVLHAAEMADLEHIDFSYDQQTLLSAVVVKVSSCAVHDLLIDPILTIRALHKISRYPGDLAREIGSVLRAAVKTNVGLVTIMLDLSKQGYVVLRPTNFADQIMTIWGGFRELVEKVLLPLAAIGVVHADIRPGFDVTSNILLRFDEEGAHMKLVDYESLVLLNDWHYPLIDGSYMDGKRKWNGTAYVWWQCVFVGYVWCKKLSASDVEHSNMIRELRNQLLRGSKDLEDWNELRASARQVNITSDCVRETLDKVERILQLALDRSGKVEGDCSSG